MLTSLSVNPGPFVASCWSTPAPPHPRSHRTSPTDRPPTSPASARLTARFRCWIGYHCPRDPHNQSRLAFLRSSRPAHHRITQPVGHGIQPAQVLASRSGTAPGEPLIAATRFLGQVRPLGGHAQVFMRARIARLAITPQTVWRARTRSSRWPSPPGRRDRHSIPAATANSAPGRAPCAPPPHRARSWSACGSAPRR